MSALLSDSDARRSVMGRLFDILDCFAGRQPVQNVASLCEQTGIPQATVHRMLATLVEWGAIEREGRGQYKLGMRMWRLGWGVPEAGELRDIARPHLVDLYTTLLAPVSRCTVDGTDVRIVDQIAGASLTHGAASRRRLALGRSAAGLVHLAHLPLSELRPLAQDPAVRLDPELARNEFFLVQKLAEVRKHRLAVIRGADGAVQIAAPVFDGAGTLRFAISATIPAEMSPERRGLARQCAAVSRTALAISEELGARLREHNQIG